MGTDLGTRPRRARWARGLALAAAACAAAAIVGSLADAGAADRAAGSSRDTRLVAASRQTFGHGAWSWFADPRAVYASGQVFAGWVDRDKYVNVAAIRNGSFSRTRIGREAKRDDHGNPSLIVRPDGKLSVYWSDHNGPAIHWRTTKRAGDIGSWGSENTLHTNTPGQQGRTYPSPVRLSSEHRSYLFWRGGDWSVTYSRTKSDGAWGSARAMIRQSGQRPYLKVASNNRDEIYLAFTQGHPRETPTNIYFAKYRKGALYHADGSRIESAGSFPMRPSSADEVYSARAHGGIPAWIHDVATDADGNPILVYATFHDKARDHRYNYARWTGTSWKSHEIAHAGGPITTHNFERHYSGGVVLDHRNPSIVYGSVKVGSHYEVAKWETKDGGKTFKRQYITRNSHVDNVRPVVPRNLPAAAHDLLWMSGRYIFYTKFKTAIVGTGR